MFEKDAEKIMNNHCDCEMLSECLTGVRTRCTDFEEEKKLLLEGIEFGYNKANEEHEGKCKTAYIKGIRTMANALKDYDRTDGAWTDYFEHTVEKVLKRLLKEEDTL